MRIRLLLVLFALFFVAACVEDDPTGKSEESAVPEPSPKADTWFAPTLHGELPFGGQDEATFADKLLFHAWDFTLTDTATAEIETIPAEEHIDTVMYLYRRAPGETKWGSYIARNDDHKGSVGSLIGGSFEAGEYRVMVKGYKDSLRGSFSITGKCEGAGCPAAATVEALTQEQVTAVVNAFDNICGDTFCGGDWNYYAADFACDFSQKSCTMTFDTRPYSETDYLPMTALDGVQANDREVSGVVSDGSGSTYVGTMIEMVDKGSDGIWLRSTCELKGSFNSYDDAMVTTGYVHLNDTLYGQFLDCLSPLETLFWKL